MPRCRLARPVREREFESSAFQNSDCPPFESSSPSPPSTASVLCPALHTHGTVARDVEPVPMDAPCPFPTLMPPETGEPCHTQPDERQERERVLLYHRTTPPHLLLLHVPPLSSCPSGASLRVRPCYAQARPPRTAQPHRTPTPRHSSILRTRLFPGCLRILPVVPPHRRPIRSSSPCACAAAVSHAHCARYVPHFAVGIRVPSTHGNLRQRQYCTSAATSPSPQPTSSSSARAKFSSLFAARRCAHTLHFAVVPRHHRPAR